MSDAKICDRCGDFYAPDDESGEVSITAMNRVTVTIEQSDLTKTPSPSLGFETTDQTASTSVPTKDLCEDCQAELDDWWTDGEEVADEQ